MNQSYKRELVNEGESPEDLQLNAKYVLSVARILGAVVFCLWNDITEVKPKMILCLVGALAKVTIGTYPIQINILNPSIRWKIRGHLRIRY